MIERRWYSLTALILGISLLLVASALTVGAAPGRSGPPNAGAEFTGSALCAICHNSDDAPLWDAWNETIHAQTVRPASADTILGDFRDETLPVVMWPDNTERLMTARDVTFVVGGRHIQRYVSIARDANGEVGYYVLPIIWNVPQTEDQVGRWSIVGIEDWNAPENDWRDNCAGCHTTGLTRETVAHNAGFSPADELRNGQIELGVGCEACHGPGGDHRGGRGDMVVTPDAQVCAQCHSQGADAQSNHPFPLDYLPGMAFDADVFTMADNADETVWWPTGHARETNAQYNEWLQSKHGSSLETLQGSTNAEAFCLRCHAAPVDSTDPSPETTLALADAEFGLTCVTCHNPHDAESNPLYPPTFGSDPDYPIRSADELEVVGTTPDDREAHEYLLKDDNYALCVACHNSSVSKDELFTVGGGMHHPVQEMFEGWAIVDGLEGITSTHFGSDSGPRCVNCHMVETAPLGAFAAAGSHSLTPVMPAEAAEGQYNSCSGCHVDLAPADLQYLIDDTQDAVRARLSVAWARVAEVGQPVEGSADIAMYEQVVAALSFVQNDGSMGVHNFAYADSLLRMASVNLSQLQAPNAVLEPTEAPAPTATPDSPITTVRTEELTVSRGIRPATVIILGVSALILLVAAFAFLRGDEGQEA